MKTLILLLITIIPALAIGATYTTLKDGSWINTTDVWSLDGINPCSCFPASTLNSDTVVLNNNIILNTDLSIQNLSVLTIGAGGSMNGSGRLISVLESELTAYGNIKVKKLMVDFNAIMSVELSELYIETRLEVNGTLNIEMANLIVEQGNVNIYPAGTFNLSGGSKLYYESGNFKNSGTTNLCSECCIQLAIGNILNDPTGIINGTGAMISDNGNIQNEGMWDPNIKWCSAGTDFGMPVAEDCPGATSSCMGIPLPAELVIFEGTAAEGYNIITWITASETNCDHFILERSVDGQTWEQRAQVNGAGTTTLQSFYSVRDYITEHVIYYYRLIQYDYDMEQAISGVISVSSIGFAPSFIYPNPNQGEFFLIMDHNYPETELSVYDINGVKVFNKRGIFDNKVLFELDIVPGLYILSIDKGHEVESLKLVVK